MCSHFPVQSGACFSSRCKALGTGVKGSAKEMASSVLYVIQRDESGARPVPSPLKGMVSEAAVAMAADDLIWQIAIGL